LKETLKNLRQKEYPGRLIILGQDPGAHNVIAVYAITARSPSSQARKLVRKADSIWTEATDEKTLSTGKTELLLYPTIYLSQGIAIGNGQQTLDIRNNLTSEKSPLQILCTALDGWSYENDPPIFTPRISGCLVSSERAALGLIKRSGNGSAFRSIFEFPLIAGEGFLISTYQGKSRDSVLAFAGEPEQVKLEARSAEDLAEAVYLSLAPTKGERDLRVAVVSVFSSDLISDQYDVVIINRYERETNFNG